ncbi:hypothetical protein HPP92_002797 [Vanilla planifolia]|uniref:Heme-binding-like protein At3g10130, chloroplastic n=1 Tax=Vanilla planifolia TaxID=51239 RepID=A0A835S0Z4_VANPL|nr:hypothetical protein HPP92_002797 [Vanilla planifolia]
MVQPRASAKLSTWMSSSTSSTKTSPTSSMIRVSTVPCTKTESDFAIPLRGTTPSTATSSTSASSGSSSPRNSISIAYGRVRVDRASRDHDEVDYGDEVCASSLETKDLWDSIQNNEYFSLEGLLDVVRQLRIYITPDLETPDFLILKRTAKFEVRRYASFIVAETKGDELSGSSGFREVAGYIFGKNSTMETFPMTTPVFTVANDTELSEVSIQIVLPKEKELSNLPEPCLEEISLRKVEEGIVAAVKFSGRPTEIVVRQKVKELRSALIQADLKPTGGCMLARYNDPGRTWSFMMKNEILIWLKEFSLD